MWMVRAGEGGVHVDEFRARSFVAIGWIEMGDLSALRTREEFAKAVEKVYPGSRKMQIANSAGQVFRFVREMKPGDRVLTYDPSKREYLVGTITGDYTYKPQLASTYPNVRAVHWDGGVQRDALSVATRNSLGAIATLFQLPAEAADVGHGHALHALGVQRVFDFLDLEVPHDGFDLFHDPVPLLKVDGSHSEHGCS